MCIGGLHYFISSYIIKAWEDSVILKGKVEADFIYIDIMPISLMWYYFFFFKWNWGKPYFPCSLDDSINNTFSDSNSRLLQDKINSMFKNLFFPQKLPFKCNNCTNFITHSTYELFLLFSNLTITKSTCNSSYALKSEFQAIFSFFFFQLSEEYFSLLSKPTFLMELQRNHHPLPPLNATLLTKEDLYMEKAQGVRFKSL